MASVCFILSSERSGSTLLTAMLNGHPQVAAFPELHVLRFSSIGEWRAGYPKALDGLDELLGFIGSEAKSCVSFSEMLPDNMETIDLHYQLASRMNDFAWIVDKTPAYIRDGSALDRVLAVGDKFIHLVRHPLGVAWSRKHRREAIRKERSRIRYYAWDLRRMWKGGWRKELQEDVVNWAACNWSVAKLLNESNREHVRLRYEDILEQPLYALDKICGFLDIDFDAQMLNPSHAVPQGVEWGLGDETVKDRRRLDVTRLSPWPEELSDLSWNYYVRSCAQEFGYKF